MIDRLGETLTVLRVLLGWTQAEPAQRAGIRATKVPRYETGRVQPIDRRGESGGGEVDAHGVQQPFEPSSCLLTLRSVVSLRIVLSFTVHARSAMLMRSFAIGNSRVLDMKPQGNPDSQQVQVLLERYIELRERGDMAPDVQELCREAPELRDGLESCIRDYEWLRESMAVGMESSPVEPGLVVIGRYRIRSLLGRGGMGEVWLAEDAQLERLVALKTLPPELAADPERLGRLKREAKVLAALDHPNIVTIHSVEEADGVHFLTMAFVEGKTLTELTVSRNIPTDRVFELGMSLADALRAAHEVGIVHRDIKPANVIVDADGRMRVLDFGLAKFQPAPAGPGAGQLTTKTRITRRGVVLGTRGYMSPEQAEGRAADARSDIYSFGVVLYELATGTRPFREGTTADPQAQSIRATRRDLPRDLQRIVGRCLAKSPEDRYPSAENLRRDLEASRRRYRRLHTGLIGAMRRPAVALPGLVLLTVGLSLAVWFWQEAAERRWAREELLPEVERLVEASWRDYSEAYELAVEAEKHIPDDPRLAALISQCSFDVSVRTEPAGARTFVKGYSSPEDDWEFLGMSPINGVRLPKTVLRWKIEKQGYETVEAAAATWDPGLPGGPLLRPAKFVRMLDPIGAVPAGMVRVQGADTRAGPLSDFFVDRYEVTNRDFKEFVDAGGYRARKHWTRNFVDNGRSVSWVEAMARFVDQTGRPGPATWHAGLYPEGQADFPVSGVSWYEAAAFARFKGKSLPTRFHWELAYGAATPIFRWSFLGGYAVFAPFSNYNGVGPREVGSLQGVTPFGAYDMAGNVREWCSNETVDGHVVSGGSWTDPPYMLVNPSHLPSMDRSPQNGFRCAYYPAPELIPEPALGTIEIPSRRDPYAEEPVPDEVFRVFRERFAYDPADLDARVESRQESQYWIHETVSYHAAYGEERITAHLFLPRGGSPPYQTVVYFPGSAVLRELSSAQIEDFIEFRVFLSYIVKNGRAVLFPVYKGTFGQRMPDTEGYHIAVKSHRYSEYQAQLVKDFRRSMDYLGTREDIDKDRIAYYGVSWGGSLGGIIPAVEERLKASILVAGSLPSDHYKPRPEADPINYLPRVRLPTLMLNGRYDMQSPPELAVRPLHSLLGTPPEHKELLLFETDHIPPRDEIISATLFWLDRYLGPVD